jgi:DNA-binding transcriptional regulator YbjK
MTTSSRTTRATEIADGAIAVLASSGSRGLTHRAVDRHLGIPEGSTSYYYRTRNALAAAAMSRMLQRHIAERAAMDFERATVERAARAFASLVELPPNAPDWERRAARHELMLESRRHPELRDGITTLRDRTVQEGEELLRQLGCEAPELGARAVTTFMNGVVIDCLVYDEALMPFDELVDHLERLIGAY